MQRHPVILIIDDDPLDREMIRLAFHEVCAGSQIHELVDGGAALDYLRGVSAFADRARYPYPQLIMTDLKMPRVDGFAVLEFLRASPHLVVVPTVVLTSSADPDDVVTAYRLGASSYIVKPGDLTELRSRIRTLVEYWSLCEAPHVLPSGEHRPTESKGKLGERFSRQPWLREMPPIPPGAGEPEKRDGS